MKTNKIGLLKKIWLKAIVLFVIIILIQIPAYTQQRGVKWAREGSAYFKVEKNEIIRYTLPENTPEVIITKKQLTPEGSSSALKFNYFSFSDDEQKLLIFTNTKRVWRLNTKGDYWVLDRTAGTFTQLG